MNSFLILAQEYAQQEYGMGYLLVSVTIILGLLVICIPRPRRSEFLEPEDIKRLQTEKMIARQLKKQKKKKKKKKKATKPKPA